MLDTYRTLGRSGLVVSPLALGTMTFGKERWGTDADSSRAVFDAYVDAGGNFIDSAEAYAEGRSEELLGRFVNERKLRDSLVIATKFGWSNGPAPTLGGNGAKNIRRAVEGSLRRLNMDFIDLYWLHVWDTVTPAEEVLRTLGELVAAGKIRYFGLSNVPAWYVAEMATLARQLGVAGPVALQLAYSLTSRTIEHEHLPAAREFGLGVTPWSPLDGGFLAGKYHREDPTAQAGRLSGENPFGDTKFNDRNWAILDVLAQVARDVDRPMAEVALAWVLARRSVSSVLIGASSVEQLRQNLACVSLSLGGDALQKLDQASEPDPAYPYAIFGQAINRRVFGAAVEPWSG